MPALARPAKSPQDAAWTRAACSDHPWARVGKVPQERASLAARTAVGCTICSALVFLPLPAEVRHYLPVGAVAATPILCYICSASEFGTTVMVALTWALSAPVLSGLVGPGTSWLAYAVSGLSWQPWVECVLMANSIFWTMIWGAVAAERTKPYAQFFGHPSLALQVALTVTLRPPYEPFVMACGPMTAWIVGCVVALLCAFLPFGLGAPRASWRVPSVAAAKLFALADYLEALAMVPDMSHASLSKARETHHRALLSSVELRHVLAAAGHERWGTHLNSAGMRELARSAEKCRISLVNVHGAGTQGLSLVDRSNLNRHQGIWRVQSDLAFATARALRAAASVTSDVAGAPAAGEVNKDPTLGSGHCDIDECRVVAEECRQARRQFWATWAEHGASAWSDIVPQDQPGDQKQFTVACQMSITLLEMCSAAEAAAHSADLSADMAAAAAKATGWCTSSCQHSGGVGLAGWLAAPFAGAAAWRRAVDVQGRYALRMSVAMFLAGAIGILFPQLPPFWGRITVGLCMTPTQGAALKKGVLRVAGSLAGAFLCYLSMLIGRSTPLQWTHTFIMAFAMKFFDRELQYAGVVAFVTFIVLAAPSQADLSDHLSFRLLAILIGVVLVMVANLFVAPQEAGVELREKEKSALRCMSDVVGLTSRTLARAVEESAEGPQRLVDEHGTANSSSEDDEEVSEEAEPGSSKFAELQARAWECNEGMFFGGDGLSGAGGLLSDVRWERRFGADKHLSCCFGLLGIPCLRGPCPVFKAPTASTRRCLSAVPALSRMSQQCYILVALLEPGLGEGAGQLLSDARVPRALGDGGAGLAKAAAGVAEPLAGRLSGHEAEGGLCSRRQALSGGGRKDGLEADGTGSSSEEVEGKGVSKSLGVQDLEARLHALGARLQMLLEGAAAGHLAAPVGIASPEAQDVGDMRAQHLTTGGLRAAAVLHALRAVHEAFQVACIDLLKKSDRSSDDEAFEDGSPSPSGDETA